MNGHMRNNLIHRMIIVLHGLIACLCLLGTTPAVGERNINQGSLQLHVEKTALAYPLSETKMLTLTLYNQSKDQITLTLAKDYRHSIGMSVFDKTDVPIALKHKTENEEENKTYSLITIGPKEEHNISIDLEDYVKIPTPGVYKIQVHYYPNPPIKENKAFITSRMILIPITDFTQNNVFSPKSKDAEETPDYLMQQALQKYSPDTVVTSMLSALQGAQWETYFTFMDLHSLYINTTTPNETFGTLNADEQATELINFRNRIIKSSQNELDISAPDHFTIERTHYTRSNAEVTVLLYNAIGKSTAIKRFMFYLNRIQDIWKVTDYNARFLGIISTQEFERTIIGKKLNNEVPQGDYDHTSVQ